MYKLTFSLQNFLNLYWQKKPIYHKQAFYDFQDLISADELAGLAMEDFIDSRAITKLSNGKWDVHHGPLNFENAPQKNWMFFVQAANHWHQNINKLIVPFKGLPNWLLDDIMVGYSTPGSSVGPHIDNYDVFIIQGEGKRNWRVGYKNVVHNENKKNKELKLIDDFEPMIDVILEKGDLLYIPAGYPHEAIALEESLSYSIGYRSSNQQELLSSFADQLIEDNKYVQYYLNPNLKIQKDTNQITKVDAHYLYQMMNDCLTDKNYFMKFLGNHLSKSRHDHNLGFNEQYTPHQIKEALYNNKKLLLLDGIKFLYFEDKSMECFLFVNGEKYKLNKNSAFIIPLIGTNRFINRTIITQSSEITIDIINFLTKMTNMGYLYFQE